MKHAIHRRGRLSNHATGSLALFVLLISAALCVGAEQTNKRETFEARYGPLAEHNIFSKERPVIKAPTTQKSAPVIQHTKEESLVLRGVAIESNGDIRAYVEDVDNAKVLKLSIGDAVGRGIITAIDIDSVEYTANGRPIWIQAGADFTGKQVIAITSDLVPSSSGGGGAPTTGPAEIINPNDPNLTMEQKLKLRRAHPELFK